VFAIVVISTVELIAPALNFVANYSRFVKRVGTHAKKVIIGYESPVDYAIRGPRAANY